ncbi:hypothetical protein QVD17_41397 [Tagetes erecta]|uniref:Uncharacterized protein n=1 Tax=Tagetes erecta TaxID=13708 RepID=A0AAD8NFI2_TARER|nr:hypothetical protein QVD17_41397 [Tagetes erecta]
MVILVVKAQQIHLRCESTLFFESTFVNHRFIFSVTDSGLFTRTQNYVFIMYNRYFTSYLHESEKEWDDIKLSVGNQVDFVKDFEVIHDFEELHIN